MIYSDEELKGLEKPPLVDGKFCLSTYRRWKTVNKLWPWDMTYEQWRDWNEKTSTPLSDNIYVRADQQLIRLSNLKHWFEAIEGRIRQGYEIDPVVLADYKARTGVSAP